jgi:beta-lactamase class A
MCPASWDRLRVTLLVTAATLIVGVPVCSANVSLSQADPFARTSLRGYLAHRAGNITAAAYDVNTGTTYLYRPHIREHTASIVKVDILATLLAQTQARRARLSPAQRAVAQAMIEISDNDAAQSLWDQEGGSAAVGAFDQRAGIDDTTPNPDHWGLTWTTASDQVDLLRRVMLPNAVLDLASRAYEYELMRHVIPSQRWGVAAGLGPGAAAALKNGWLPLTPADWQVNSIGSIAGSGRHYLLAVLTNRDPTEAYGIATIEHISATVWRTLERRELSGSFSPAARRSIRTPVSSTRQAPQAARR